MVGFTLIFGLDFIDFWSPVWESDFNMNQHQTNPEGGLRGHPRHEPLPGRHTTGFRLISELCFIDFGMKFNKFWKAVQGSVFKSGLLFTSVWRLYSGVLQSRGLHSRSLGITYCRFFRIYWSAAHR